MIPAKLSTSRSLTPDGAYLIEVNHRFIHISASATQVTCVRILRKSARNPDIEIVLNVPYRYISAFRSDDFPLDRFTYAGIIICCLSYDSFISTFDKVCPIRAKILIAVMEKAGIADKRLVIDILSRAFDSNQSVNHVIRQGKKRQAALNALMEYSCEVCLMSGDVWLSDDRQACTLVLYPQNKRVTVKKILLDIRLIFKAIGVSRLRKALKREHQIKEKQPEGPALYVWFIGVSPPEQHKGTGSQLFRQVLADAAQKSLPVYLETSVARNLAWYRQFGFEVYDSLELGHTLYFLWKI